MDRVPEPDLMTGEAQARAYAEADFAEPHEAFVVRFAEALPDAAPTQVVDLGCGPGDVAQRFARVYSSCRVTGVDGSPAMLAEGRRRLAKLPHGDRIDLVQGYLPGATLPLPRFDTVISNSLLHHLEDPAVIWDSVRAYGEPSATVFVMDLMRPASAEQARAMVDQYTAGEPEVLRSDFYHSLLAAYRPAEVKTQLGSAELSHLSVEVISDRHLIVFGRL